MNHTVCRLYLVTPPLWLMSCPITDGDRIEEYKMKLMGVNANLSNLPNTAIACDACVTMSSCQFAYIIHHLASICELESVCIKVSKEGICFSGNKGSTQWQITSKQTDGASQQFKNHVQEKPKKLDKLSSVCSLLFLYCWAVCHQLHRAQNQKRRQRRMTSKKSVMMECTLKWHKNSACHFKSSTLSASPSVLHSQTMSNLHSKMTILSLWVTSCIYREFC